MTVIENIDVFFHIGNSVKSWTRNILEFLNICLIRDKCGECVKYFR